MTARPTGPAADHPARTTSPTDPASPAGPTDPGRPASPASTAGPTDPGRPASPASPASPTDPGRPASPARPAGPVRLGPRSLAALFLVSAVGLAGFCWPLFAAPEASVNAHSQDAPWLFAAVLLLLVGVVAAAIAESGLGAKAVAMLGVLAAAGAALRPIGAGTAGLEPMFFLMVLSGRVLGPGFGFTLGSVTMFASALLTGGVGPWLPFQMLAMSWFTMGAGLLPGPHRLGGRAEVALLAAYGFVASLAYGTITNLAGWTFMAGLSSDIAYRADAGLPANLAHFVAYCLTTSMGWDLGRACLTTVLTATLGPTLLRALRRATRRAAFEAPVSFSAPDGPDGPERIRAGSGEVSDGTAGARSGPV